MSDNDTTPPITLTTQRQSEESGLQNLAKNTGGQLQRGEDGLLRLVHPLVRRDEDA